MSKISERWYEWLARQASPRVLEIGTHRWESDRPGGHRREVLAANPKALYTGCDFITGDDVDLVADAHILSQSVKPGSVDALLCIATLEHLERPWVAAVEFRRVLRKGGWLLISTHQSFPLHGYPNDYFRFSAEALTVLFGEGVGWKVLSVEYEYPCKVVPLTNDVQSLRWNFEAVAWLNANILAEKTHDPGA